MRALLVTTALAISAGWAGTVVAQAPHWESLLPDSPPAGAQPRPVPGCKKASLACVDRQLRTMRRLQAAFGCDHRGVFATTYLTLTRELRREAARADSAFRWPRYLYREIALFASYYYRALRRHAAGLPVPPAWEIALDTARDGEVNAGQDMLLAISAHVQSDMPFVLAELGLVDKRGRSRKPDHDFANEILERAYQDVIDAVADRYDPLLRTTNAEWNPFEDAAALEMVRGWRENVWRNAERLLRAQTPAERAAVARSIEDAAAAWARAMAAPQQPGYRARRAAYCESGPAGRAGADSKPPKTVASRST